MFRNYLKIAYRNLLKFKTFSFINITGLTLGITIAMFILLWVKDELNYDTFHSKADSIYRLVIEQKNNGEVITMPNSPGNLASALKEAYPEIESTCRVFVQTSRRYTVKYYDKIFNESNVAIVDPAFLTMFDFPWLKGNLATALDNPTSIILTEREAQKYFGDEDPVGKVLRLDDEFDLTVTGVMKDIPSNSHLKFNFVLPTLFLERAGLPLNTWNYFWFSTYVLLKNGTDANLINKKIKNEFDKYIPDTELGLRMDPMTSIHLHANLNYDSAEIGDMKNVSIFSAIAIFIILIASINFMNLSTARSGLRAKEIGMRKVVGAGRKDIAKQFLAESMVVTFISMIFSIILLEMLLPVFNSISGKDLSFGVIGNVADALWLVGIFIIVGLLAGSYPAFYLSGFNTVKVMKNEMKTGKKGRVIRRMLVVTQFALSIILIVGTMVVSNQLDFMRNKDLGFNKDQLIAVTASGKSSEIYDNLRNSLKNFPEIKDVTIMDQNPTVIAHSTPSVNWEGKDPNYELSFTTLETDYNYFDVFDIPVKEGTSFRRDMVNLTGAKYILNETAVKQMHIDSPVGKRVTLFGDEGTVVGVVKDYHLQSLHHQIAPMIIKLRKEAGFSIMRMSGYVTIVAKLEGKNISRSLALLQNEWEKVNPGYAFEYRFVDESFASLYKADETFGNIFKYFSYFALFIASLGLFGLALFMTEQKTKEIGIRKALGSSVYSIIYLLTKEFVKWVVVANIIAWPAAYYFMSGWMQDFPYKDDLSIWTFILAGLLALVISILTVSYQTIKVAMANPIKSLRYE